MIRRASDLSDAVIKDARLVRLEGRIAATIPCPNENAVWVTVKVAGDSLVEVGDA